MSARRAKRRKTLRKSKRVNMTAICLVASTILLITFIALSLTVLFKTTNIIVIGDSVYTYEDVVFASEIKKDGNLIRLDTQAASKSILNALAYIENVKITKKLPSTVVIELTPAIEFAKAMSGSRYAIINSRGRILALTASKRSDLPLLVGAQADETDFGIKRIYISFDSERTKNALTELADVFDEKGIDNVTHIFMKDYLDVAFVIDGRIRVEMGTVNELKYKMKFVSRIISDEDIPSDAYAIIDTSNTSRVSFKTSYTTAITVDDIIKIK